MVVLLRSPKPARIHHPYVAQRKVVAHRVVGIHPAQRRSDVGGHFPAWRAVSRETKTLPQSDHVCIEGDDQARTRQTGPDAEVDRIPTHHPSQEEIQAFTRTTGRRPREEVPNSGTLRHAAVNRP